MPNDAVNPRKWLALAALISIVVTIVIVSLHLRESHGARPDAAIRSSTSAG
jgi:hypothetical protein